MFHVEFPRNPTGLGYITKQGKADKWSMLLPFIPDLKNGEYVLRHDYEALTLTVARTLFNSGSIGGPSDRRQRASELLEKLMITDDESLLQMNQKLMNYVLNPVQPLNGLSTEADGTQQLTYCRKDWGGIQIKFKPLNVPAAAADNSFVMPKIMLRKLSYPILPVLMCYLCDIF